MSKIYLHSSNKKFYFIAIALSGLCLRIAVSKFGHMIDMDFWKINVDIYKLGGTLYERGHYNYGPIWINTLYILDRLPLNTGNDFDSLRIKVVLFLSIIDFFLFIILIKIHSLKIATIFYLNPISIFISGYHNQFDNFAILFGFLAVIIYEKNKKEVGFFSSLILIGISLSIKHILFLFPLWMAIKESNLKKKILIIIIPVIIFIGSFANYIFTEGDFILKNVFKYKSYDNGPFWSLFTPQFLGSYLGLRNLFLMAMILFGLIIKKKSILDSFYIYLISVVIFSSAIANQYLAIPLIALAVFWNPYYLFFTLICCVYFLINRDALYMPSIMELLNWSRKKDLFGYKVLILFLSVGFFYTLLGKEKFNLIIKKILNWFLRNLKEQLKIK
jgi:hypothetical protein